VDKITKGYLCDHSCGNTETCHIENKRHILVTWEMEYIHVDACGMYLEMLPLSDSICTGRRQANHTFLNHGFILYCGMESKHGTNSTIQTTATDCLTAFRTVHDIG
jgi:hypothetical protein